MDGDKTVQEKFREIRPKLQSVLGGIINDISQTDGENERLLHENHETEYKLTSLTDSRELSDS